MHPSGTAGKAWDAYMAADRKLLKDSEETLQAALEQVRLVKPDFVLVTGDLTKDGEKQCHEKFAAYLKDLKDAGIQAYVNPGNHDINNPDAARYLPSGGKEQFRRSLLRSSRKYIPTLAMHRPFTAIRQA